MCNQVGPFKLQSGTGKKRKETLCGIDVNQTKFTFWQVCGYWHKVVAVVICYLLYLHFVQTMELDHHQSVTIHSLHFQVCIIIVIWLLTSPK